MYPLFNFFEALDSRCSANPSVIDEVANNLDLAGINYLREKSIIIVGPSGETEITPDIYTLSNPNRALWYLDGSENKNKIEDYKNNCNLIGLESKFIRRTLKDAAVEKSLEFLL